eukprot:CAMPEP_0119482588 /NCGR_PEP_ID=MMETSP1344-20130328/10373_1 /TAXON_ID=236787 /ORGANISM="Florenciella parvula, Strain CCMP2471" /LENGTH=1515 /DNA_ID=CAMNT_0007517003 /DNA_START=73 /DNA_END=4620 /DNA_ORIENTATION=+
MADDAPAEEPTPAEETESLVADEPADAPAAEEEADAPAAEEEADAPAAEEEADAAVAKEDRPESPDSDVDDHVPMLDVGCPDEMGIPEDPNADVPGDGTEMTAIVAKSDGGEETALGGDDAPERVRPARPTRANTIDHGKGVIARLKQATQDRLPESFMLNGDEVVPTINAGWDKEPEDQYLSWELMQHEVIQRRPTWFEKDENGVSTGVVLDIEPVCFDMGTHVPCGEPVETKCGTIPANQCYKDNDHLDQFGLGINLYFKYLKFMWHMFTWMTIFCIPAMHFYNQGVDMDSAEKELHESAHGLMGILYYGTAGSWGTPEILQYSVSEGETIEIKCDQGKTISNVVAYYGEPWGYTSCPAVQKPNNQGVCPTNKKHDYEYGPTPMKLIKFGINVDDAGCCSHYADNQGVADLSPYPKRAETKGASPDDNVEISKNQACTSDTENYIAHGLCLGKSECSISANGTKGFAWHGDTPCSPIEDTANKYDCETSFTKMGNFSGCTNNCQYVGQPVGWVCDSYDKMELKVIAMCQGTMVTSQLSKLDAMTVIAYMDAFGMLFLFAMFVWLDKSQMDEEEEVDGSTVSADDYTVCIMSLPKKTDQGENTFDHKKLKQDIKDHFRRVLNECEPVHPDNANHDCHVVDVNFVLPNVGEVLFRKKKLGILARKLNKVNTQYAMAKLFNAKKSRIKLYEKQMQVMEKVFKHYYIEAGKAVNKMENDCYATRAFVTFDSEEAYVRCRRAYPDLGKLLSLGQPSALRLHGYEDFTHKCGTQHHLGCCHCGEGYRLRVVPAPGASDLLWGNLGLSSGSRKCRSCITCIIMLIVLLISFCVIGVSKLAAEQFEAQYPTYESCGTMTARFAHKDFNRTWHEGDTTHLTTYDVVKDYHYNYYGLTEGNTGKLGCMCGKMMTEKSNKYGATRAWNYVTNYHFKAVYPNGTGGLNQDDPYEFHEGDCDQYTSGSSKYHECVRDKSKLCKAYMWGQLEVTALKVWNVVAVAGVNLMLEALIDATTRFERHESFSTELTSKTFKLFCATLFNTGLMTLIINANLNYFDTRLASRLTQFLDIEISEEFSIAILNGSYSDFSAGWYLAVGVAVILQIIINIIAHPVADIVAWNLDAFARIRDRGWKWRDPGPDGPHITKQATQDDLIDKYSGAEFKLEKRYAKQLTVIFLVLLFSGGMPYLNVAGMFYFAIILLTDKVLFIKWYRKPTPYGSALAKVVANVLPYAVFGHLCFSMWMYTDATVFPGDGADLQLSAGATYSNTTAVDVTADLTDALGDISDSPFARILGLGSSRAWRVSAPLFVVWLIVLLYILFKDFLIPFFTEFKWFLVPFGLKLDAEEGWEGNPDYFDSLPLETLETAVDQKDHIYDKEILEIYKEKLEIRKTERKSMIEQRKSLAAGDMPAPQTTEPTADDDKEAEEPDEETGLGDDEIDDSERPSMEPFRFMMPGVLETYNPMANEVYEKFFAEEVVELLVAEYGMPTMEEAGKLKLKDLDDVPNPPGTPGNDEEEGGADVEG